MAAPSSGLVVVEGRGYAAFSARNARRSGPVQVTTVIYTSKVPFHIGAVPL
jgi:hypothetical protein